ncbi:hypothetical protein DL93DRAFT_2084304 [Clavulina sp. PMI_390]|nr:hypothetical protein DL93DRAFT_2084304 [Clavulina sp. PMI_390]
MNTVVDTLAGTHLSTAGIDKSKEVVSDRETASLPSQELFGARTMGGPRDGVGALPGHRDESGVAILPDDKEALANKAPDFAMESTTGPESLPATTEPTTSSTTWTESAKATAAGLTAAGYAAGATAQRVYEKPHEYIPGMKAPSNDTSARTLPSEDVEGQLPSSGRMDGVGALPGHRDESGVAILPDDKAALANKPADTAVEPTNTNSTSWTQSAKATGAGLTAAGYAAGATAQHVYEKPHEFIPGMRAGLNDGHTQPHHQTQTLPSEDVQGQLPLSGRMDGVGALPGGVNEEGVALLPEEKAHPNPLATSEIAAGKTNETLASPYNESSPYSNPEDNTIAQPSTAPGVSTKDKMEGKAEDLKNKVTPSKTTESTDTTTSEESTDSTGKKKVGFMSKLKGQSKIISGKLGGNTDKVEEGRAIKSGSNA